MQRDGYETIPQENLFLRFKKDEIDSWRCEKINLN